VFSQPIRTIMERRKFATVPPGTSVREASELMAKKQIGAVLVVEEKRLIGIFSERDVVFRVVARGLDPATTPLLQVMTPEPKTIKPNNTFGYAMTLMHENGFRHLPVIDEHGQVQGVISIGDIVKAKIDEIRVEAESLKQYIAG